jgi:hypothetical protein
MLELGRHMCFGCLNSATCAEHALLWSVCSVLLELSLQPRCKVAATVCFG